MSLDMILSENSLYVMAAIAGIVEALKLALKRGGIMENKVVQALLPLIPLALGAVAAFIPGALPVPETAAVAQAATQAASATIAHVPSEAVQVGPRLVSGLVLGAMSGHGYKVVKTNLDLVRGKL